MTRKLVLLALLLAVIAGVLALPAYFGTPARISAQEAEDNPFGEPAADQPVSPFGPAPGDVAPPVKEKASPKPKAKPKPKPKAPSKPLVKGPMRSGEKAILEALDQTYPLVLENTSLDDLAEIFRERLKINTLLDRRELYDVGVVTDETLVPFDCRHLPLGSHLSLTLESLDLVWTIDGQVLWITTPEKEENMLETKVYEVSDLVQAMDEHGQIYADFDSLVDAITDGVEPDTWAEVGGPGTIDGISLRHGEALVVRQTFRIQRKVAEMLAELRALAKKNTKGSGPAMPPYKPRVPSLGFGCGMGGMGGMGMGMGMFNSEAPGQPAAPAGGSPAAGGAGGTCTPGQTPPASPCGPVPPPCAPPACGPVGGLRAW